MTARERGPALTVVVAVVRPLVMALTRRDWRGADLLPDGGFVLAANHISHADPLVLAHFVNDAGIPPRFLAKASVLDLPGIGALLRAAGQIPVHRNSPDAGNALSAAVAAVERGECIIVYPEGTLTRDPRLWPMAGKTGAVRIALATGCPVVPVAQWGAQRVLPPGARLPRLLPPPDVSVCVGPPVAIDDLRGRPLSAAVLREGTARVMAAITRQLEGLRHEQSPTLPFEPGWDSAKRSRVQPEGREVG